MYKFNGTYTSGEVNDTLKTYINGIMQRNANRPTKKHSKISPTLTFLLVKDIRRIPSIKNLYSQASFNTHRLVAKPLLLPFVA